MTLPLLGRLHCGNFPNFPRGPETLRGTKEANQRNWALLISGAQKDGALGEGQVVLAEATRMDDTKAVCKLYL